MIFFVYCLLSLSVMVIFLYVIFKNFAYLKTGKEYTFDKFILILCAIMLLGIFYGSIDLGQMIHGNRRERIVWTDVNFDELVMAHRIECPKPEESRLKRFFKGLNNRHKKSDSDRIK